MYKSTTEEKFYSVINQCLVDVYSIQRLSFTEFNECFSLEKDSDGWYLAIDSLALSDMIGEQLINSSTSNHLYDGIDDYQMYIEDNLEHFWLKVYTKFGIKDHEELTMLYLSAFDIELYENIMQCIKLLEQYGFHEVLKQGTLVQYGHDNIDETIELTIPGDSGILLLSPGKNIVYRGFHETMLGLDISDHEQLEQYLWEFTQEDEI